MISGCCSVFGKRYMVCYVAFGTIPAVICSWFQWLWYVVGDMCLLYSVLAVICGCNKMMLHCCLVNVLALKDQRWNDVLVALFVVVALMLIVCIGCCINLLGAAFFVTSPGRLGGRGCSRVRGGKCLSLFMLLHDMWLLHCFWYNICGLLRWYCFVQEIWFVAVILVRCSD